MQLTPPLVQDFSHHGTSDTCQLWLERNSIQETWLSIPKPWCSGFDSSSLSSAMAPKKTLVGQPHHSLVVLSMKLPGLQTTIEKRLQIQAKDAIITETLPQLHEENSVLQSYIMSHYNMPQRNTIKTATLPLNSNETHTKKTSFLFSTLHWLCYSTVGWRIAASPPKHWVVSDYNLIGKTMAWFVYSRSRTL